MFSPIDALRRGIIVAHRWLGVALCLLFLVWFLSGIAMMYVQFPEVTPQDRIDRSPALMPASIRVSPAEAGAALGIDFPAGLPILTTLAGRPVYRFAGAGTVYADTGERLVTVPESMRLAVAAGWTGLAGRDATVERIDEPDQWTVQGELSDGPLWKYSWPSGEQVYLSESADVVQYTTRASRFAAYLGPIPHWFYFRPLRVNGARWARIVIWSSAAGTLSAVLGLIVAIWMYSPSRRYRRDGAPAAWPYRGLKRWHLVLGLVFGVISVTWAFSGMLSMDPFPYRDGGNAATHPGHEIPYVLRGGAELSAFEGRHPREALALVPHLEVKELQLASFDGAPIYIAALSGGRTHIVPVSGPPAGTLGTKRVMQIVQRVAGAGGLVRLDEVRQYDRYYRDRHRQRPLPVVVAELADAQRTRFYIHPGTGEIVETYTAADWRTRWLYQALHRLDFPWLYNHRPLWDIVVLTGLLGGTALCVTSIGLAWKAIGRALARLLPAQTDRLRERAS